MGFRDFLLDRVVFSSRPEGFDPLSNPEPAEKFISDSDLEALLPWYTSGDTTLPTKPGRVSREDALSVPAIKRARDLICGTAAYLPLHVRNAERADLKNDFLNQPERGRPRSVTMSMTYEDLFFDNISYWRITERLTRDGFPRWAEYLAPERVSENVKGKIYVDGNEADLRNIIRFTGMFPKRIGRDGIAISGDDGLLSDGGRAIRTLLALDDTAKRYAESPMAQGYIRPKDGIDPDDLILTDITGLTDEEIEYARNAGIRAVLDSMEASRRRNVIGYLSGAFEWVQTQFDATQIGLKEQRAHAILEIARLTGLDASYLNSAPDGKPETYANSEQKRQDLIDLTLAQYLYPVEQRLSMNDITARGQEVKYNFDGFLRGDTLTRMQAYNLGIQVGAYTEDEIREEEDKAPLTPTQKMELEDRRRAATPPREIKGEVVN